MNTKIEEKQISLEELQNIDIGGNSVQSLYVESLTKPCKYLVKDLKAVSTEWGVRVDYFIEDDVSEWRISSWNIIMKGKIKALDLVGKNIELSQSKVNPKKMLLEVLA